MYATQTWGGGSLKETVLWTNPSPTSGFNGGDITVPDMSGYKYIKITYWANEVGGLMSAMIPYEDWDNEEPQYHYSARLGLCSYSANNSLFWNRVCSFNSATSITFGESLGYFYSRAPVVSKNTSIPVQIIGLK